MTRSEQAAADFVALLRARNACLWVTTREERRVEKAIIDHAKAGHRYEPVFWDCAAGLTDAAGETIDASLDDPESILKHIGANPLRRLYVLRDFDRHLESPFVARRLRNLCIALPRAGLDEARAIVILTPDGSPPPQIGAHAIVLDWPLPERQEIGAILDSIASRRPELAETLVNGLRERAVDAAIGLTAQEIEATYSRSIVTTGQIDPDQVSADKRRVIAREKVLSWIDPDPRGLDAVGGLELYKAWVGQRKLALGSRAREYGLPAPKGVLTVGVPGCGKSLMAKCIAAAWQIRLLRLDFGALKSSLVGSSEALLRKALGVAESLAPVVLWVDEIEKGLAGAQGGHDAGVSADQLGYFLSWMQDRSAPVFVVATANDVSSLPAELLRRGRFDELFFVDLPTRGERLAILQATLAQYRREIPPAALDAIARATDGFSGAELAAIVPDALFTAFADNARELTAADLEAAAANVCPLSKTAAERIDGLRQWAKGRARPASAPESAEQHDARDLDVFGLDDRR